MNAGIMARNHVSTDPANLARGQQWWQHCPPFADAIVPHSANAQEPDTWDPALFPNLKDAVYLPYEELGFGTYPECFFCDCNLLPRRQPAQGPSAAKRIPSQKARRSASFALHSPGALPET